MAKSLRLALPDSAGFVEVPERLPILPLRDVTIFPHATLPLFVGRARSLAALETAVTGEKILFAVTQRAPDTARPGGRDLHRVGTFVRLLQLFRLPDGTMRILVQGIGRGWMERFIEDDHYAAGIVSVLEDVEETSSETIETLAGDVREAFGHYVELNRRLAPEVGLAVRGVSDPAILSCVIASHLRADVALKQQLLEAACASERLRQLRYVLGEAVRELSANSTGRGRQDVAEGPPFAGALGECADELEELAQAIEDARMPKPVEEKAFRELDRLGKMSLVSPEATVCRGYLDWLIHLPWRQRTRDRTELGRAAKILDEDHYGLRKVKDRVLELISVIKLSREVRGPILCLTGPPGVGKTSLGRSIARSLGRKFVRMSLGGVRDESEIRGHRRTYIGSLPGRILQAMRRAGTVNPVILLDEVDKLGSDHRGDPAAALLEVLDPEQNSAFNDHYLEVDYDLSKVLFITTANLLHAIPEPLRDRMEVIRIPGYLESEKAEIAKRFLLPRQLQANGLTRQDLALGEDVLLQLIRGYTREAGVRNLEREIARICRRVAKVKAGGQDKVLGSSPLKGKRGPRPTVVSCDLLRRLLGPPRHEDLTIDRASRVGVATGLAWTSVGGEVLTVEAGVLPGRGNLLLTGQLGTTMRESAQAALSYIRSRGEALGLDRGFYRRVDIHIHVPEGAVPKDGPSAGVTLALAMASALTGIPTRTGVAMTGEITLRGNVLAVGGVAEKLVAARRTGIEMVALPRGNHEHLGELPAELIEGLRIESLETMDEVLALGLEAAPEAKVRPLGAHPVPPIAA